MEQCEKKTPGGIAGVNNIFDAEKSNMVEPGATELKQPISDATGTGGNIINLEKDGVVDSWISADLSGKFELKKDGVYFVHFSEKENDNDIKICDPLRIAYWTATTDQEQFGIVLEWTDKLGRVRTLPVGNGQIQNKATEIRGALAQFGLGNIKPKGGSNSKDYLQLYLLSARPKQKLVLADKLGWLESDNNYFFVMPKETIGDQEQKVVFDDSHINMNWIKTAGTLAEWQGQIAKPALASTRCTFAISLVFASTLMDLLDGYVDSRFFQFGGKSSTGKTTALKFAQSVLGYRKELPNWRATINGLEATALAHNDCTMFLDEIGVADKPDDIPKYVYMLCGGTTRIRGNVHLTANKEKNWTLLGLASGEIALDQLALERKIKVKAGQQIRLVNIPADAGGGFGVFERVPDGYANMTDLFKRVTTAFRNQHGTAFDAWIRHLVSLRNFSDMAENLRGTLIKQIDDFVVEVKHGRKFTEEQERVAKTFGLVAVAGDMASGGSLDPLAEKESPNITGWQCSEIGNRGDAWKASIECFNAWFSDYSKINGLSWDSQQIVSNAIWILETQQSRFLKEKADKDATGIEYSQVIPRDMLGWYAFKDNQIEFYVQSAPFSVEFCKGARHNDVCNVLEGIGILLDRDGTCHPSSRNGQSTPVHIMVHVDLNEKLEKVDTNKEEETE